MWLAGLAGAALLAPVVQRRRDRTVWVALLAALVPATVGAGLLVGTEHDRDTDTEAVIPHTPICEERNLPVCVHPAYEAIAHQATVIVGDIVQPLVGLPGGPVRAEFHPSNGVYLADDGTLHFGASFCELCAGVDEWPQELVRDLVWDVRVPNEAGRFDAPRYGWFTNEVQYVIGSWLLRRSGHGERATHPIAEEWLTSMRAEDRARILLTALDPAIDRFAALDPAAQRAWLAANWLDLRAGRLTTNDLP